MHLNFDFLSLIILFFNITDKPLPLLTLLLVSFNFIYLLFDCGLVYYSYDYFDNLLYIYLSINLV